MTYDFDKITDRQNTNCMSTDGYREYMFPSFGDIQFPYADSQFIRMWIADMEFQTPEAIRNAIKDRLDHGIFGYSKVFDPDYYRAMLNWTESRYGWSFDKTHLLTSPGIIPALYELVEYICAPDEKVMIVTPSYAFFKHAADYNHVELVISELINNDGYYTMDYDDLRTKAADPKVKLCIFCNPHNPTGRIWTESELKTFGDICLENDVMMISDEIHCDLIRTGTQHTPLAKVFPDTDQIITCMSPSKTFNMAGLMFSNIVIPNQAIREKWLIRHYPFDNPLSITATQAAYTEGAEWLTALKAYLDANFDFVDSFIKTELPKASFRIPEATYLAWIDISAYLPDEENLPLFFAKNAGVLLEGGDMFVSNSRGHIRLNLACPRAILAEGLERIKKAMV
ncbi:MAG: cysteine-S-conjugate beta-lyase [Clostridiales bacterium]|jgi:cystathionine beta-lyase|nr:cysteine-S-conjugate beta-lyase [Clostridiales bacterium]